MKTYTVIGLWESTGQVFVDLQQAKEPYLAMRQSAREEGGSDDLCILGAVHTENEFVLPGCDNDKSAYASDLVAE